MKTTIRSYTELSKINSFTMRYRYLKLNGVVGEETFGFERYLNQRFYQSREWRHIRDLVILRDNGCDLGVEGRIIADRVYIHHMNPISTDDILKTSEFLMNPEYLICVSYGTHQAIHYGDEGLLLTDYVERKPNDTCPWKLSLR